MIRIVASPRLRLRSLDQVEDLRLDRHVERRGRLVGDQHARLQRQRHRDHRPLPHPAGEFVRVVVDASLRVGDADRIEQLDRPLARRALARPRRVVRADRLDDLLADRVDGVQRGHRVLEDHRDLARRGPSAAALRSASISSSPRSFTEPSIRELGERVRPMIVCAVTLFPDPDSPTIASTSPGSSVEVDAVDRLQPAAFGGEADPQAAHLSSDRRRPAARRVSSRE